MANTPVIYTVTLPTGTDPVTLARYVALGVALNGEFGSILTALDCGPAQGVVPYWSVTPTPAQIAAFEAVVNGWSFTQLTIEAFELAVIAKVGAPAQLVRYLAAVTLKESSSWATLTAGQQNVVQGYINSAGAAILAIVQGL